VDKLVAKFEEFTLMKSSITKKKEIILMSSNDQKRSTSANRDAREPKEYFENERQKTRIYINERKNVKLTNKGVN
jgi:hypothetical protein